MSQPGSTVTRQTTIQEPWKWVLAQGQPTDTCSLGQAILGTPPVCEMFWQVAPSPFPAPVLPSPSGSNQVLPAHWHGGRGVGRAQATPECMRLGVVCCLLSCMWCCPVPLQKLPPPFLKEQKQENMNSTGHDLSSPKEIHRKGDLHFESQFGCQLSRVLRMEVMSRQSGACVGQHKELGAGCGCKDH